MENHHLQMVYLLKMVIFHGYVSHNQMVSGFLAPDPQPEDLPTWHR
jgi:hypothetical protein